MDKNIPDDAKSLEYNIDPSRLTKEYRLEAQRSRQDNEEARNAEKDPSFEMLKPLNG